MNRSCIVVLTTLLSTAVSAETVQVPRIRFIQGTPVYDFFLPIKIKVRAQDVRGLDDLRVRLFANRTPDSVKVTRLGETDSGCFILRSRVESYDPSVVDPDILLREIYDTDLRCIDGNLASTPFVLVVESANTPDSNLLKIDSKIINKYFRYLYAFKVVPPPGQSCRPPVTSPTPRPPATRPTRTERAEAAQLTTVDAPPDDCIKTIE